VLLQYDKRKYPKEFGPLEDDIRSLFAQIKAGLSSAEGAVTLKHKLSSTSLITQNAPPFKKRAPPNPTRMLHDQITLVRQLRSVCEIAGAALDAVAKTSASSFEVEEWESISGCYGGTKFQISVHGIPNSILEPDEFFVVWEEPENACHRSLAPGIKLLVDALDAIIASKKYVQILERAHASPF
jgi:hypothetical protein